MRDTMIHRGPNHGGIWISSNHRVGLAHRRLSIIDLSPSASQPMSNQDGTLWITYNGEIYNHAEIRKELESTGRFTWKTDHSDTEVILHAFAQWGIECLEKFRGMFAIALWDSKEEALWLIRDRMGIKPLYYSLHSDNISFASEIKALLQDPSQTREVQEEALFHYFSFMAAPAPHTLFKGIRKLSPGTWLRVTADGKTQEYEYWDVWDHTRSLQGWTEEEVAHQLLTELQSSVALRKVADVPVGVFLSGGIDSSSIAALFSEGESGGVKSFSMGYSGEHPQYTNELHYAQFMADHCGTDHHEYLISPEDVREFFPKMIELQDEPLGDPLCVPAYFLSKLARSQGIIVCQAGEGSDELFGGYPSWDIYKHTWDKFGLNVYPGLHQHPIVLPFRLMAHKLLGQHRSQSYELLHRRMQGKPIFWGGLDEYDVLTDQQKRALLSPTLRKKFSDLSSWDVIRPFWDRYQSQAWEISPLNWMSYIDLKVKLPEVWMMRNDKMGMGVSLETRVPFLDHKFVEFAMSIPTAMKIKNGTFKNILRKALQKVLPDSIMNRPKQSFGLPVHNWFTHWFGSRGHQEFTSICKETDLFDPKEVQRILASPSPLQLWYLMNFVFWWKIYIKRETF